MRVLLFLLIMLATPMAVQAAGLASYDIAIKDGVFDPPSIEVPANERFKINVTNTGSGPAEFENLSLRVEKVLGPGVQSFVVIHPLKPGSYNFIDEFHMDLAGFTVISK